MSVLISVLTVPLPLVGAPLMGGASSDIPEIAEIVTVTPHSGWREGGLHFMALEFSIAEGWQTYWRLLHGGGIPTEIKIQTENIEIDTIFWQNPMIFDDAFAETFVKTVGYKTNFALPFSLKTAPDMGDIAIEGSVSLGLCADICIPATLDFADILSPIPHRSPKISAMMQKGPKRFSEKALCDILPNAHRVTLFAELPFLPTLESGVIFVEALSHPTFTAELERQSTARGVAFKALLERHDGAPFEIMERDVRITLIDEGRAFEVTGCKEKTPAHRAGR